MALNAVTEGHCQFQLRPGGRCNPPPLSGFGARDLIRAVEAKPLEAQEIPKNELKSQDFPFKFQYKGNSDSFVLSVTGSFEFYSCSQLTVPHA